MSKVDEAIELLEQKQNRTPKEESGLRELKILDANIRELNARMEPLKSANATDSMGGEYRRLVLESQTCMRKARSIMMDLGLLEKHRKPRPTYVRPTKEEQEEHEKLMKEEMKRMEEERRRKELEQEFEEWKRKKESGELEFEEYRMRKQFMQIVVQQQEEILRAIRSGLASTQSAIRDNAEQTAQADAYYRTSWENYRIQDEMLRDFFR